MPTLRNRGLHDVGHVGAATGRGAKPRQAILKGAAQTSRHLPASGAIWLFRLTRRQSRRRCARDVTLLASVPLSLNPQGSRRFLRYGQLNIK